MHPSQIEGTSSRSAFRAVVGAFILAAGLPGCAAPRGGAGAPTQADRLMKAYSELEAGRFFVLADFEGEGADRLVELVNASGKAATKIDPRRGKPETGGAALEFKSASDADTIVFASNGEGAGYFKRDWRPYDELMMSVYSPVEDCRLHLGLGAGASAESRSVFTQIPLAKGWNTARVDLAELEGRAPLDDMRELRLSVAGARKAVAVRIDDVLLTRSRKDLLGDSANTTGGLYVQQVSGHWNIGAGGRFEISFTNGQIARWYNLASDPHRIRNLVEGTTLGPTPVSGNPTTGEHRPLVSPGAQVRVDQRIVEMSPVRVVVEVDWLGSAVGTPKEEPLVSFRYVIYPTGQIYTQAAVAPSIVPPGDDPLGLLVTLAAGSESDAEVRTLSAPSEDGRTSSFFAVRQPAANAVLAFVPAGSEGPLLHTYNAAMRQVALLATGAAQREWRAHLYLGDAGSMDEPGLTVRASDFLSPARIEYLIGSAAGAGQPGRRADGFDPAEGCYRALPDGGRLRMKIDGSARPMLSPAFCVEGISGRRGWVYLRHLIHEPVAVTSQGAIVFQLPAEVRESRLVEVVLEAPAKASLP